MLQAAGLGEGYHKHKAIPLVLRDGSGNVYPAQAAPKSSSDTEAINVASHDLVHDSKQRQDFPMSEFFHCAFSCNHQIACEKGCLNKEGIPQGEVETEGDARTLQGSN